MDFVEAEMCNIMVKSGKKSACTYGGAAGSGSGCGGALCRILSWTPEFGGQELGLDLRDMEDEA